MRDLKSRAFRREGSSPSSGIRVRKMQTQELQLVVNRFGEKKPISQIPTRQLVAILRVYRCRFYYDDYGWETYTQTEDTLSSVMQIKEVLANREHIPNRKESRLNRQRNAKKFKSSRNKNRN